ncbi:MAG: YqeG family HAD IIIA-type phosphatase, partial [Oscillospiraceae bacterium]
ILNDTFKKEDVIMLSLYPQYRFEGISQITVEDLKKMGVRGVAVDLDNTTAHDHTDIPLEGVVEWIAMVKQAGFKVIILSNGNKARAGRFAKLLDNIEFVAMACKPLVSAYIRTQRVLGLKPRQIAMIGDQIFTDIWGANFAGWVSVYVMPFAMEERNVKSFKRRRNLEKKIFAKMDAKGKKEINTN